MGILAPLRNELMKYRKRKHLSLDGLVAGLDPEGGVAGDFEPDLFTPHRSFTPGPSFSARQQYNLFSSSQTYLSDTSTPPVEQPMQQPEEQGWIHNEDRPLPQEDAGDLIDDPNTAISGTYDSVLEQQLIEHALQQMFETQAAEPPMPEDPTPVPDYDQCLMTEPLFDQVMDQLQQSHQQAQLEQEQLEDERQQQLEQLVNPFAMSGPFG